MPPVRFEPTISAGGRPQTYTLDRAADGTVQSLYYWRIFKTVGLKWKVVINSCCSQTLPSNEGTAVFWDWCSFRLSVSFDTHSVASHVKTENKLFISSEVTGCLKHSVPNSHRTLHLRYRVFRIRCVRFEDVIEWVTLSEKFYMNSCTIVSRYVVTRLSTFCYPDQQIHNKHTNTLTHTHTHTHTYIYIYKQYFVHCKHSYMGG